MRGISRLGDTIEGMTAGEHSGHIPAHGPSPITGTISGGCSSNVFIDGFPVALEGSITDEHDVCCGSSQGSVGSSGSSVLINGKPIACVGTPVNAHNGTATVTGGSSSVFIGGD